MAEIARNAGLGRECLYEALAPGAKPRHETVQAVLRALGMTVSIAPAATQVVTEG
jgi:probable addiction module antidote protein